MREKTIFEKIIDREIPAEIVYEDDNFIAFLSIEPQNAGHTLVVPKQWCRWVWDCSKYIEYCNLARKIAIALREAYSVELVRSEIYSESVPYAHIHVFPEISDDTKSDLKKHGQLIREALK